MTGFQQFKHFAAFDLETTGLYAAAGDTVVEVASIIVADGKPVDSFHRYYMPKGKLSPEVRAIHGLNRRTVRKLRREQGAEYPERWGKDWGSLVKWWKENDIEIIAAHNIKFDASFFPYGALDGFRKICTMENLTDYCNIETFFGDTIRDGVWDSKWPKLMEAFDILKADGRLRQIFPEEEMSNLTPHSAMDDTKVVACLVASM